MGKARRIFKSDKTGSLILQELLQNIFIAELLSPSKQDFGFP